MASQAPDSVQTFDEEEDDWYSWNKDTLAEKLKDAGLAETAEKFKEKGVVGKHLPTMTDEILDEMEVRVSKARLQVHQFIKDTCDIRKVFNDPIHGHIDLHPLCVKVVDTPQFQRLRFIKQLGACYLVYPGASHNRFEHSIGVGYLAGQLARAIQRRQPNLEITEKDILCVEIAGLCHDLGHGPFSYLFENKFIPAVRAGSEWKHEEASRKMFSYMLMDPELKKNFEKYGLTDKDIIFIKEQLYREEPQAEELYRREGPQAKEWCYEGRPKEKGFLYEIVANKRNGIDVKKWDYLARDCYMLGIKNSFDYTRCLQFARVIEVDGEKQICTRDKEAGNLYEMFHTNWKLHNFAYQHRVTNLIETMIAEAMVKTNGRLTFKGEDGTDVSMLKITDDMKAYSQLTDYVFDQILHSTNPDMAEAKQILQNVLHRKLYKFVAQTHLLKDDQIVNEALIRDEMIKDINEIIKNMDQTNVQIPDNSVIIVPVNMDYGMKNKNPIDNVRFYRKDKPNVAVKIKRDHVSYTLPETYAEQRIRVHSRVSDKRSITMIKEAFIQYCKNKNYPVPEGNGVVRPRSD